MRIMDDKQVSSFTINYRVIETWPSLAWVAILEPNNPSITVKCGEKVETKATAAISKHILEVISL